MYALSYATEPFRLSLPRTRSTLTLFPASSNVPETCTPLAAGHTYDDALSFALEVGKAVEQLMPGTTLERALNKRKGRLYLDCMQNAFGKTIVAPYSLRGGDGAPVSAPLKWSEVNESLDPTQYNLKTMTARLAKLGDLFAPALEGGVRLPRVKG